MRYHEIVEALELDKQTEDRHPNDRPYGPETKPTMPKGTVRVDVSDVYDWYKLGMHISDLEGLGKHDFGKGPPSTIFSFGSEEEEHKYIKGLEKTGLTTTDIDPVDPDQPPGMPRQKTDPTFNVNEVFNTPYKTKTEKSESGSYDVLAKLPDGSNLSIMFNNEGDDEWQVEFYRNNSQEVTGEGDAQRIFATVLNAIQQFIKEHKPWRIIFSASKDVDMDADNVDKFNPESRAKLYDRLVQRYARAWGYDAYNEDHGDQVTYELTRLNPGVAENFADGKNPGRKGLSKRVGVNTKASVSDLRKTAKNSSGEKQRMAHWLANMKSGRAKAKKK